MSTNSFDVVVIGSGPGGYVAAIRASQLGFKTALIEKHKALGGTCLHVGCIPTKAMLQSAHVFHQSHNAKKFGIKIGDIELDYPGVRNRKDFIVNKMSKGVSFLMKKNEITVFRGHGRITGKGQVSVTAQDGGVQSISTRFTLIATGSVPRDVAAFPVDHKTILNSDSVIMHLDRVPKSLVVIGGGAVGTEFASVYHRFGSKVTLIEMQPTILPIEDEEISKELQKILKRSKMDIWSDTGVTKVTKTENGVRIEAKTAKGEVKVVEAEMLLSAIGRAPVTSDIGLDKTNIKTDRGFIPVDPYMQTTEAGVYAIGDVIPTAQLAHVASAEAILAVEHMSGKEVRPINYDHVPNCTYAAPEVASVGLTEKVARERGYDVKVGKFPFSVLGKANILDEAVGMVKIVAEKKYDEVLGIHIVGPHATDLIAEGVAALELETTTEFLGKVIHPHPTVSEGIMEAVHATLGHAIHL